LKIKYCNSALECVREADALVLVTEWDEFRRVDLPALAAAMTTPILVDGRNIFSPDDATAAGFDYAGIGRRARGPRVKHEVGALHQ
jgi:UDPglucose 6-dehydrogenase